MPPQGTGPIALALCDPLVALAKAGADVLGELDKTDTIIKDYVPGRAVFFRAP